MKILIETENLSQACQDRIFDEVYAILRKNASEIRADMEYYPSESEAYKDMDGWQNGADEQAFLLNKQKKENK